MPSVFVCLISGVVGLLMVVVFRYTSDQEAIRIAKDHLKAHLLALRLFQDQLVVVLRSYGQVVMATGAYLRLMFKPLLIVILPLTLLLIQLDRYLGYQPIRAGEPFLLQASATHGSELSDVTLQLPEGLTATAPALHVPAESLVMWRLLAAKSGAYIVKVEDSGVTLEKSVVVGSGLVRLSPVRFRQKPWERFLYSSEPAIPEESPIAAVKVQYPSRIISFGGFDWNWIWLFFVLSMAAGFLLKTIIGIEI